MQNKNHTVNIFRRQIIPQKLRCKDLFLDNVFRIRAHISVDDEFIEMFISLLVR
jgi:hypothetical protein